MNTPIIFTKDSQDTAEFLRVLEKKEPNKEMALRVKKARSMQEQLQIIIEGFPGIGPTLAKNLLKKFGTIEAIINAPLEELEKTPKIGRKKAELIKRIIVAKY